jgi:hypothetical protein
MPNNSNYYMKSLFLFMAALLTGLVSIAQSVGYQIDCTVKNVKENGEVVLVKGLTEKPSRRPK